MKWIAAILTRVLLILLGVVSYFAVGHLIGEIGFFDSSDYLLLIVYITAVAGVINQWAE